MSRSYYAPHALEQSLSNPNDFRSRCLILGLVHILFANHHCHQEKQPYKTAAIIVNVLFGVTLLGWVLALVLASKQPQQPVIVVYNSPPPSR